MLLFFINSDNGENMARCYKITRFNGGLIFPEGAQIDGLTVSDNDLDFPGVFVLILTQVKHRRRVTEIQVNGQR